MISKWFDKGNKCISIEFDSFNWYNIFRINNTDSIKGINSYVEKNLWLFGFKFTYIDVNYDDIVFIEIKPENNYTSSEDSKNVKSLKSILKTWIDNNEYTKNHPPFNWNYFVQDDGEYIYFITGPKKYFEEHGLKCLINGIREITFDKDNEIYFQKYNPFKTNKVFRIPTYYNED